MHRNMSAISFIPQDKSSCVINEDLELVSEEEKVELMEENFEIIGETENGDKCETQVFVYAR